MQTKTRKAGAVVAALLAGTMAGAGATHADLLGSVLKGAGIGILIKQFNKPINEGINKLTNSAGAPIDEATKVVPIVSVGQGSYVGAAQVSGPQDALDQVQAVGMLEGSVSGKTFRLKALVPIDTDKPRGGKTLRRVKGVGVSAIVDIKV
nr:hypothetical protein [Armatimonadota bacterium]